MKVLKKIIIVLIIIALLAVIAYFSVRFYISKQFASIPIIEKSANFGEHLNITNDNLNIAISNINYDKENNMFDFEIDFSTVDEKGLNSYILYDYLVYDADKNIIATSFLESLDTPKRMFILGFSEENYNSISFKTITDKAIGSWSYQNLMTDVGKIKYHYEVSNLKPNLNLNTLTFRLTNIQYQELEQKETIMANTDFVFTFNQ